MTDIKDAIMAEETAMRGLFETVFKDMKDEKCETLSEPVLECMVIWNKIVKNHPDVENIPGARERVEKVASDMAEAFFYTTMST